MLLWKRQLIEISVTLGSFAFNEKSEKRENYRYSYLLPMSSTSSRMQRCSQSVMTALTLDMSLIKATVELPSAAFSQDFYLQSHC